MQFGRLQRFHVWTVLADVRKFAVSFSKRASQLKLLSMGQGVCNTEAVVEGPITISKKLKPFGPLRRWQRPQRGIQQ